MHFRCFLRLYSYLFIAMSAMSQSLSGRVMSRALLYAICNVFMNMITTRTWFCSAYITNTNLSYANFSKVVLEKCELWENRWMGTQVLGATFSGSDLSGGEFSTFDWRAANFTHCDLTNSELGDLDIRGVDLQGVKLDSYQASLLMERLGIAVIG